MQAQMLPYIVAASHNRYAICLPHYINAMDKLPASVEYEFKKGNFSVHHKRGTFNGVWADMALEQSYNKDAKTHLFNGITHQENTMDKYIHALPLMTCVSKQVL